MYCYGLMETINEPSMIQSNLRNKVCRSSCVIFFVIFKVNNVINYIINYE